MKKLTLLITLLMSSTAFADIPPDIPEGSEFVSHYVQIENMADHPDFTIVVYDPATEGLIRASLVFTADSDERQLLVNGRSWQSLADFGNPGLWLLPRDAQTEWSSATAVEIDRQREACFERGEGCVHASRFSPRFAPPEGALDCNVRVDVQAQRPTDPDTPAEVVDVFRVTEASADRCVAERVADASTPAVSGENAIWPWLLALGGLLALTGVLVVFARRSKQKQPEQIAAT